MRLDVLLRTGLVVCLVLLLAAACGGAPARQSAPPKLPRALAERWAGEADNVAAALQANDCPGAQQLARSLAVEVNADLSQIPARLRSTVVTAAATLAGRISCQPKPPKKKGPKGPKDGHGPGPGQGDGG